MSDKIVPRNVTPILQIIRNVLLGRKHTAEHSSLRYAPLLSARTQPKPILPDGEAHKLSANYYYSRDGRCQVKPPHILQSTLISQKQIQSGSLDSKKPTTQQRKPVTPGKHWEWD